MGVGVQSGGDRGLDVNQVIVKCKSKWGGQVKGEGVGWVVVNQELKLL